MADVGSLEVRAKDFVIKAKLFIEGLSQFEPEVISGSFKHLEDQERVERACRSVLEIGECIQEKLSDVLNKTEAVIQQRRNEEDRGRQWTDKKDSGFYSTGSVIFQDNGELSSSENTATTKGTSERVDKLGIEEERNGLDSLQLVANPSDERGDSNYTEV